MTDTSDFEVVCDTASDEGQTVVTFSGRGLKLDTAQDAEVVTKAIAECDKLITLNLEGNTLGIEAADAIGHALRFKPDLRYALLKDLFTGRLKTEIPEALLHLTEGIAAAGAQLYELDLSDNAFGPIGMQALVKFVGGPACREMRVLKLNNNGLGIQGANLLSTVIDRLVHLRTLVIGRNRLENEGAGALANALSKIDSLRVLELPQNGIRVEGVQKLANAILGHRRLTTLNLNDNTMTEAGGQAIASALEVLERVQIVNFGDCLLRSGGCQAVLDALNKGGHLPHLQRLLLNGNEIGGHEVVDVLCEVFSEQVNASLELDLSCNNFGDASVERLFNDVAGRVSLTLDDDEGPLEDRTDDSEPRSNFQLPDVQQLIQTPHTTIEDLVNCFVQIAVNAFDDARNSLTSEALERIDRIVEASIEKQQNDPYAFANQLLVHLGLLKNESKDRKVVHDLRGPFSALTHVTNKLSREQKDVLQLFIGNRPNKYAEKAAHQKHELLQALFA